MARPQEYNQTIIDKAQDYLADPQGTVHSLEGLALYLGIHRSTIYDWKDKHDEFSDIVEKVLQHQAKKLQDKGLTGEFNSSITKLLLTKHGYSDKQDVDHTSKGNEIKPILGGMSNGVQGNDSNEQTVETNKED